MINYSLARIADLIVRFGDFKYFINKAHFLDNLSWKATFIKFTICQRIKLSISSFCCLEMFSEFKTISTAFLWLTSTKTQLYRSLLKALGRVLLVTAINSMFNYSLYKALFFFLKIAGVVFTEFNCKRFLFDRPFFFLLSVYAYVSCFRICSTENLNPSVFIHGPYWDSDQ